MKTHFKIIKNLPLWKNSISVNKLTGGITNSNYLIEDGQDKYVAHFGPATAELLGLNRQQGIFNTRKAFAQGLGPELVGFYSEYDLLILRYLPGEVFTPEIAQKQENLLAVASLLKKLHQGEKFQGTEDIFDSIAEYLKRTREHNGWMPEKMEVWKNSLFEIKRSIGNLENNSPCHLDVVTGNFVKTLEGLKLLDWEYSAQADYRFDLGAFALYAELDKEKEVFFLKSYGENIPLDLFQLFKAIMAFREAAWGMLQLVISPIDFDYKRSVEKYCALFERYGGGIEKDL